MTARCLSKKSLFLPSHPSPVSLPDINGRGRVLLKEEDSIMQGCMVVFPKASQYTEGTAVFRLEVQTRRTQIVSSLDKIFNS